MFARWRRECDERDVYVFEAFFTVAGQSCRFADISDRSVLQIIIFIIWTEYFLDSSIPNTFYFILRTLSLLQVCEPQLPGLSQDFEEAWQDVACLSMPTGVHLSATQAALGARKLLRPHRAPISYLLQASGWREWHPKWRLRSGAVILVFKSTYIKYPTVCKFSSEK